MRKLKITALLALAALTGGCYTPPVKADFEMGEAVGKLNADLASGGKEAREAWGGLASANFEAGMTARASEFVTQTQMLVANPNLNTVANHVETGNWFAESVLKESDTYRHNLEVMNDVIDKLITSPQRMVDVTLFERGEDRQARASVQASRRDAISKSSTDILAAAVARQKIEEPEDDDPQPEPEPEPEPETHKRSF